MINIDGIEYRTAAQWEKKHRHVLKGQLKKGVERSWRSPNGNETMMFYSVEQTRPWAKKDVEAVNRRRRGTLCANAHIRIYALLPAKIVKKNSSLPAVAGGLLLLLGCALVRQHLRTSRGELRTRDSTASGKQLRRLPDMSIIAATRRSRYEQAENSQMGDTSMAPIFLWSAHRPFHVGTGCMPVQKGSH